MSDFEYFVHLSSLTMNPANMTREAGAEAGRTWLCMGCNFPKPGMQRVDVHLMNRSLQGPMNLVLGFGIPLARRSFLLRLGEERVKEYLYLGEVFGPDGRRWDDWATFRGKHGLICRGSTEHAGNRVCSDCGRNCYFGMPPNYLFPEPPVDIEIFQCGMGLVIPDRVAREVGIGDTAQCVRGVELLDWPEVGVKGKRGHLLVERLKVLPEPMDGLPSLSIYAT